MSSPSPAALRAADTIANTPYRVHASTMAVIIDAEMATDRAELIDVLQSFVDLWPVLPGWNQPKATPQVIAVWQKAKAALAKHSQTKTK